MFSSIAACIGIVAEMLGETLYAPWLVYADPVAGLFVSLLVLKIAVSPHLTVLEAHEIGKRVKEKLLTFPQVHNVMVHINPYDEQ